MNQHFVYLAPFSEKILFDAYNVIYHIGDLFIRRNVYSLFQKYVLQ